jgi:signal transduction histidine kinase/ActR/RegA family two-component response regulator
MIFGVLCSIGRLSGELPLSWRERGTPPPIAADPSGRWRVRAVESSFRRSLWRATVVPVILLTAGSALLIAVVAALRTAHGWVDHTDVVIGRANLLQKLTIEREDALRGFLLSHEQAFLDHFNDVDLRLSPLFDELQDLVDDNPDQVEKLRTSRVEVIRSRHHAAQQLDRIREGESVEAVARHVDEGTAITRKVLDGLEAFMATESALRPGRVRGADELTSYVVVIGATLGIVVGGTIALATASQMRRVRRRYVDLLEQQERTERALADANALLRDTDRRKDEFLGLLSHELRNPLAPIRNSIQVLGRADPGSEPSRRARAVIERQFEHLTHLVEDLLDLKRISAGKMRIRPERIDLLARVRELIEDMRAVFVLKGVRLDLRATADPVWVDADATRIAQVVGNLLQNAAKFTDPSGIVTVTVGTIDEMAHVKVRDTGIGMSPEVLRTVFEPFVQAPQSIERSRGGLGLGLALVRGIVELHGGAVHVRSQTGEGTEFDVSLPLAQTSVGVEPPTAATGGEAVPHRILVVEDNEDAAASLCDLLELVGPHDVAVAHDGAEGLEAARRLHPDLILCDLGLPTMDGYEVARQLRTTDEEPGPTLVALSGYAAPEDVERSMSAGFDYHLPKPLDLEALQRIIADSPLRGPPSSSNGSVHDEPRGHRPA